MLDSIFYADERKQQDKRTAMNQRSLALFGTPSAQSQHIVMYINGLETTKCKPGGHP